MADEATLNQESPVDKAAPQRPLSLLASEMFGSNFTGEVEDTPEIAQEVEQEPADEPATNEAAEAVEATEDEGGESPLSSVSELVQHFELDPEWFDALEVADLKVDGKPTKATLKELKDSYQIQEAAKHRLETAKERAKEIIQEATAKQEAAQSQFSVVSKLIENAEKLLAQDVQAVDPKLRVDDPGEWSAKQREFEERRRKIDETKQEAGKAYQEAVKKAQEEFEKRRQEHLRTEYQTLLEKLPEWHDEGARKTGQAKLADYLVSQGFSQQDVMGASDHRLILMARKAMLYDELQANTNAAKKKVAKVPKVLKPGAPKPKEQISRERVEQARAKLRKSGSLDDAYALLKARRGGN